MRNKAYAYLASCVIEDLEQQSLISLFYGSNQMMISLKDQIIKVPTDRQFLKNYIQ